MKTFATLALLAVAACAVDINAEASFHNHDTSKSKDKDKTAETDHTVEVNIWTMVDNELMELMDEVNALIASVALQTGSLTAAQVSFATLATETTDLRTSSQTNAVSIQTQRAIDKDQDTKLERLVADVTALEHKVATLDNKAMLLQERVNKLPDISVFDATLNAIKATNSDLETSVNLTKVAVQAMQDSYNVADGKLTSITDKFENATTGYDFIVGELESLIADTKVVADANTLYLGAPDPTLSTQTITSDYLKVNDDVIMLSMATVNVDTFILCPGETLEFQLALSDVSGLNMAMTDVSTGNRVLSVALLANSEVAASATIDTNVRDSQHRLFYKFDNDDVGSITYTIQIMTQMTGAMDDTDPFIRAGNLQWGFRTYADTYVLATDSSALICT